MRRRISWATLACATAGALLLPGSGAPMAGRMHAAALVDLVTIEKTAPASTTVGQVMDYRITLTYTGELTEPTAAYTVTDPLPPEVRFQSWGAVPQGTCPTTPGVGQSGTVSCTVQFTPSAKTVTFTLRVSAAQEGTATNTATLSGGGSASATTTIGPSTGPTSGGSVPAAPGSITATLSGPVTITSHEDVIPPRFAYTLSLTYTGPTPDPSVHARFTLRTSEHVRNPGIRSVTSGAIDNCTFTEQGVPAPDVSCDAFFTAAQRTVAFPVEVRASGTAGLGRATVELTTGATASVDTTFVFVPKPVTPPAAPPPIAGASAAPTKTVVETLTREGQAEPESVVVSSTTKTAQIALTWNDPDSRLDVRAIQLVPLARAPAVAPGLVARTEAAPPKLRITKRYRGRSVNVTIKNLRRGRLKFKIVAVELGGRTRATAKIRQSKR